MRLAFRTLVLSVIAVWCCSCEGDESKLGIGDDDQPQKTDSIAELYKISDKYSAAKSYLDRTVNPNFKLGVGVGLFEYVYDAQAKYLVDTNFDEIATAYLMKHAGMVGNDGRINFGNVDLLFSHTSSIGTSVYGHTLVWHANQNATYLNSLVPQGGTNNIVGNGDFELGTLSGWSGWGNNSRVSVSEEGKGYGSEGDCGYALQFTNPKVGEYYYSAQIFTPLHFELENGTTYRLSFKIKADRDAVIRPEVQSEDYSSDGFGTVNVTSSWQTVSLTAKVTADDRNRLIISYAETPATLLIDDVVLLKDGDVLDNRSTTAARKKIFADVMERWISEMVTHCKPYVHAWDVVNEPMDDNSPYALKSGIGRTNLSSDEFYWQDYLGKDYAVLAFKLAAKYGNADDKLFINDYNLEYSLDKCKGIIEYVKFIESKGARVDGIGTQMHISTDTDRGRIVEMFKLLAATGKLVRVSELDIRMGKTELDCDKMKAQADMYRFVVESYFKYVPQGQRYGITVWGLKDSEAGSAWLAEEQQALWNESYRRKYAFKGFCDGIAGYEVYPVE